MGVGANILMDFHSLSQLLMMVILLIIKIKKKRLIYFNRDAIYNMYTARK